MGGLAAMDRPGQRRQGRKAALLSASLIAWAMAGCLSQPWPNPFSDSRPGAFVQDGTVVVRDGEEVQINFKKPFDALPRIEITGFVQSLFKSESYSKSSFEIVQPSAMG